jgi:LysM repeat protein
MTPNATQNPMAILQQYATQTAIAAGGASLPTPTPIVAGQTPVAAGGTQTAPLITPIVTFTPVPGAVLPTATTGVAAPPPNVVVPTSTPGKPATYTLQLGEYPYCIARRFNVNPEELLAVNGLTNSSVVQAGTVLKIPTTGNAFPGNAALIPHPANYTVKSGDTVYSVACDYGNADRIRSSTPIVCRVPLIRSLLEMSSSFLNKTSITNTWRAPGCFILSPGCHLN